MPSMYNELNMVINDYVGYKEGWDDEFNEQECADEILHLNITNECSMHIKDPLDVPLDKMSSDAQWCIKEWEEMMIDFPLAHNPDQYEFNFSERKVTWMTRLLERFRRPRTRKQ